MITRTPRLVLRQFGVADSTALIDVFGDTAVMHYGDGVKSPAWVEGWISGEQKSYEERGYGKWAVINRDGDLLGYCG